MKILVWISYGLLSWAFVLAIKDNMPFDTIDCSHFILGSGIVVLALLENDILAFVSGCLIATFLVSVSAISIFTALTTILSAFGIIYLINKLEF